MQSSPFMKDNKHMKMTLNIKMQKIVKTYQIPVSVIFLTFMILYLQVNCYFPLLTPRQGNLKLARLEQFKRGTNLMSYIKIYIVYKNGKLFVRYY